MLCKTAWLEGICRWNDFSLFPRLRNDCKCGLWRTSFTCIFFCAISVNLFFPLYQNFVKGACYVSLVQRASLEICKVVLRLFFYFEDSTAKFILQISIKSIFLPRNWIGIFLPIYIVGQLHELHCVSSLALESVHCCIIFIYLHRIMMLQTMAYLLFIASHPSISSSPFASHPSLFCLPHKLVSVS